MAQTKIGWRPYVATTTVTESSLWTSIYSVYNADAVGSSSLKTSLFAAYNGESNANDSFGTNNGTAVGGLTYGTGKIGNAFQSNGTNSYISLPDNSLNLTGDFSISTWVYFTGLGTWQEVISNYFNTSMTQSGWDISVSPVGVLNFSTYRSNEIYQALAYNISSYLNQWVHLVVTRKPTVSNGHKIYINGTLVAQQTGMDPVYNSTQWCNINSLKYNGGVSYHLLSGSKIDALNIWTKELTSTEITELYNSGNGAQYITDSFYKPTTSDALNTYNGTAQGGLTYGVGKVGTAFQFNGSNAYVELGDVMDVGTSSWSYSMWVNPSELTNGNYYSFLGKNQAANAIGRFLMNFYGNKLQFYFQTFNFMQIETVATFSTNTWYHLTFVIDRASNLKIYVNGTLAAVNVTAGTNDLTAFNTYNYTNNFPFRIGTQTLGDNVTPVNFFKGLIDEVGVWSRILTQSEITELYNSGNGKQYPN